VNHHELSAVGDGAIPAVKSPQRTLGVQDEHFDPLLGCLEIAADHYGRSMSAAALISGLPLVDGRLTPQLVLRAASRVGLSARIVKRRIGELLKILFPVILLMEGNNAIVLVDHDGETATIALPETGKGTVSMPLPSLANSYTGYAILIKPEYRLPQEQQDAAKTQGHWFWSAVAPLWPAYVQVFLAALLINILVIAAPLFMMNVYDRVLPNKAIATLWVLAIGMGAVVFFDLILKVTRHALLSNAGRRADVLLASRIFAHVLKLDLGKRPLKTGEFANQLRDYEMVREFFTSNTVVTLTDFAFIGLFIIIVYYIAGLVALIPAVAVVLVIGIGTLLQLPLVRRVRQVQTEATHRHSILLEALNGLETIKCARAEGQYQRQWEQFIGHNSRTTEHMRSLSTLAMNITGFIQQLVSVGVIVAGVYVFSAGHVTSGAIIAAVILSSRAVAPLGQTASTISRAQQAFQAYKTLDRIMQLPAEDEGRARHINRSINDGRISFDNVTFRYPESEAPAINGFDLKIEPGERVGIIGRIGSGKTTLGRLLARLYLATEGTLFLDGVDVRQYHPAEVRRCVGFVSQDTILFYGSVRDNIALGVPHISDDLVLRAAEISGVIDFVKAHPKGLNMQVGEGGRFLSSGQRQAVILARACLLEPLVVFLDEPSGAMDMATERAFVQRLHHAFRPDQTLILTTHRYNVLSLVNRLVVIERGCVVADGPRDEILAKLNQGSGQRNAAVPVSEGEKETGGQTSGDLAMREPGDSKEAAPLRSIGS
jgi:ATP-binding cassette subfamily C protein LapB